MKITDIRMGLISVPLRVPFKTALRSVNSVEAVSYTHLKGIIWLQGQLHF